MSLILDGTNGLSDVDGSAATPAIRGSDANTGIFFPAADIIAFAEGGAEAMRIDANGNVGIGTTSPNVTNDATSGRKFLSVIGTAQRGVLDLGSTSSSGVASGTIRFVNGSNSVAEIASNSDSGSTTAGNLQFLTVGSERARIDSSGNLLIATTSVPSVNNARVGVVGTFAGDSNSTALAEQRTALVLRQDAGSSSNNQGAYSCLVLSAAQGLSDNPGVMLRGYGGSTGSTYNIQINGNGNITNTNNSYGSLSDESLKENIVDATPKLNDLMAVQVRSYNLKADEKKTKQLGVVAQELEAVFPAMVETEADKLKSVKYSVFVPMLIKAIQELKGINDAQAQIITALTARVEALEGAQA
jgi:hypothetical protein